MRFLVAVDGSPQALGAVRKLIACALRWRSTPEVHLLHVLEARHDGRGADSEDGGVSQASEWLEGARLPLRVHALTGTAPESIARTARELGCDMIWMGTRADGGVHGRALGATAARVLQLSDLPVVLVKEI